MNHGFRAGLTAWTPPPIRRRPRARGPRPASGLPRRTALVEIFSTRLELVYAAGTRAELDRLKNDVPEPTNPGRFVLNVITGGSRGSHEISLAWRVPRIPRMILPQRDRAVIGRSPLSDFVVADQTVSAVHAVLTYVDGKWAVRDEGSLNGTFVNGWRVVDDILVRPGDELTIGASRFVLAAPTV